MIFPLRSPIKVTIQNELATIYDWLVSDTMYFYNINQALRILEPSGLNPEKGYERTQVIKYVLIASGIISIIYLVSIFLFYRRESISLSNIINSLESIGLLVHGLVKATNMFANRSKIYTLLNLMQNQFWRVEDIVDDKERTDNLKSLKLLKIVCHIYLVVCTITCIGFFARALVFEGRHTVFESYCPEWCPHYLLLAYEFIVYIFGAYIPIVGTDLLVLSLFILTSIQFRLLNLEMQNIFDHKETDVETLERLKKCVNHHIFLQDYVNRLNETFSKLLLIYNGIIIISMCIGMYVISIQDSVQESAKSMTYTLNGFIEYIICYCIPAQAISNEADKVGTSAYFSKWYDISTHSVKIVILMTIMRGQTSTTIAAWGFLKVNMETCLKTIQTIVSYYMFLRTMGFAE